MPNPAATRPLGKSGLQISQLGFGSGPVGNLFTATSDADALAALAAMRAAGLNYLDVAPFYGLGLAERRVGDALRQLGRADVVVSTKVGRLLKARTSGTASTNLFQDPLPFDVVFDYSYDGVMRSFEDSLQRLGTNRIDILLIHDINQKYHAGQIDQRLREVMEGGYRALDRLRSEGAIRAFGAGTSDLAVCTKLMEAGDFDCFMIPGRFTLLDQSAAASFLPECQRRRIGVLMAAPFDSGILATGPVESATYNYQPATPHILEKVRQLQAICMAHRVPLAAAALQFPLRHPAVSSVVTGMKSATEVAKNAENMNTAIPDSLWRDLIAPARIQI
jgi:D-threo-aldose 1-dehydrogenase